MYAKILWTIVKLLIGFVDYGRPFIFQHDHAAANTSDMAFWKREHVLEQGLLAF